MAEGSKKLNPALREGFYAVENIINRYLTETYYYQFVIS